MRRFVVLAGAALAIGGWVLYYHGPGRAFVRGHVGDVAATMLVYAILGLLQHVVASAPLGTAWRRLLVTLAIAAGIEGGQLFWTGTGLAGELLVGGSFDGWDFAAYALGALLAVAYDLALDARPSG
ncbi:MAG: DUF2809 domain-containing protein [Kofleriaceae bacterium]